MGVKNVWILLFLQVADLNVPVSKLKDKNVNYLISAWFVDFSVLAFLTKMSGNQAEKSKFSENTRAYRGVAYTE